MVLVQQAGSSTDGDWLGNLINWLIFYIAGAIMYPFGLLFVLLGAPNFYYETMTGLALFPPEATAYSSTFDA